MPSAPAKRRLDCAIAAISPDVTASVTWRPFELNPDMPKAGVDRRAYRSAKFGSWQHSQALDAQVAAAGRLEGLVFKHDKMERTPNTVDAHRLIWLAGQQGKQDVVVEGLFAAYFNEGRDNARRKRRPASVRWARSAPGTRRAASGGEARGCRDLSPSGLRHERERLDRLLWKYCRQPLMPKRL